MDWMNEIISLNCPYLFNIKDERFPDRNGIWFSNRSYHNDTSTWSHDESFPIRVTRVDHSYLDYNDRVMICGMLCFWLQLEAYKAKTDDLLNQLHYLQTKIEIWFEEYTNEL
jgi:hypothetical protein